uniref:MFS transporter n=1 Tax=Janibacter limosus TaxID=53458 RepID=A0AC61U1Y2_9MICO|nr:MFS transporter [Janibacter limosus]
MSASTSSIDAAPATPTGRGGGGVVIAVLALCGTVVSLQQTMVLPLVPDLPGLIGTTAGNASWMITATLVAGAVATPVISRMADMYGKRRMIPVTPAIVALGALVGGLSTSLPFLILARALQGMGMALVPIGIATMRDELDPDKVPLAVALMSATPAIGAGVGLPLGGFLAEAFDWHVVLWLPGVLALLLIGLVPATVSESNVRTAGAFDVRGAVLLSPALVLLLLAVSKGSDWGWIDARTLGCLAAGIVLLAVFVPPRAAHPQPPRRHPHGRTARRHGRQRHLDLHGLRDVHQHARVDPAAADPRRDGLRSGPRRPARRAVDGPVSGRLRRPRTSLRVGDPALRRRDRHRCGGRDHGRVVPRPDPVQRHDRVGGHRHRRRHRGHRAGLLGAADTDHAVRARHRDGRGQRAQHPAALRRDLDRQRGHRRRPRGDDHQRQRLPDLRWHGDDVRPGRWRLGREPRTRPALRPPTARRGRHPLPRVPDRRPRGARPGRRRPGKGDRRRRRHRDGGPWQPHGLVAHRLRR